MISNYLTIVNAALKLRASACEAVPSRLRCRTRGVKLSPIILGRGLFDGGALQDDQALYAATGKREHLIHLLA